jgi:hypothetical protein
MACAGAFQDIKVRTALNAFTRARRPVARRHPHHQGMAPMSHHHCVLGIAKS